MANYIISILRTKLMIVFSWGFHSASAIAGGLKFNVNAYKYTGEIIIKYNEGTDLFNIEFTATGETISDVYADNLINVIDNQIEYCDNYEEKVKET